MLVVQILLLYPYLHLPKNLISIVDKDQLSKFTGENKVLITFTNLEGALILKNKGYNPTFVLVLPKDKLSYKKHVYVTIKKYCLNQNPSINENVK